MTKMIERRSLAERLKAGLVEGIQFAKGELSLRTTQLPERPPVIAAREVISLRQAAGMSQAVFARVLNVSAKTIQSWEQGQRKPSQAALRMLQVLREKPETVFEVVGVSGLQGCRATIQKKGLRRRLQVRVARAKATKRTSRAFGKPVEV